MMEYEMIKIKLQGEKNTIIINKKQISHEKKLKNDKITKKKLKEF